jgi:hypothetical protein
MVAPFTAFDLVRVMEHEMHHHHENANRRRAWRRRGNGQADGEQAASTAASAIRPGRRPNGTSLFSLFSKPVS